MFTGMASARAGAAAAHELGRRPPDAAAKRWIRRSKFMSVNVKNNAPAETVPLRKRIFQTLEEPSSSWLAKLIALVVLFFIILSVVAYIAGTLLAFTGPDGETGSCPLEDGMSLGGYYTMPDGTPVLPLEACDPDAWPSPPPPTPPPSQPLSPPGEPPVFDFFAPVQLERVTLLGILTNSDSDSDAPSDASPTDASPDDPSAPSSSADGALPPCARCAWPDAALWALVELVCVMVFTVEYVARLLTCPAGQRLAWAAEPLNVVDVVAIVPWYFERVAGAASGNTQVVRALRLLRIFRISKASKKFALLHIFMRTMQKSVDPHMVKVAVLARPQRATTGSSDGI